MSVHTPFGDFGPPPDAVAWGALMLAGIALGPGVARRFRAIPANWLVAALAVFAAVLSALYVAVYLRGGPRIVELDYKIAPGYYLYRERFKFDSPDAKLGPPQIPVTSGAGWR